MLGRRTCRGGTVGLEKHLVVRSSAGREISMRRIQAFRSRIPHVHSFVERNLSDELYLFPVSC